MIQPTHAQTQVHKAARGFAKGEFDREARQAEKIRRFPENVFRRAADFGFVGM